MTPYIKGLFNQKDNINKKITNYQNNKCKHINVIKTHGGDTGNYDPSSDQWWIDYKCPDCDKFWREYIINK